MRGEKKRGAALTVYLQAHKISSTCEMITWNGTRIILFLLYCFFLSVEEDKIISCYLFIFLLGGGLGFFHRHLGVCVWVNTKNQTKTWREGETPVHSTSNLSSFFLRQSLFFSLQIFYCCCCCCPFFFARLFRLLLVSAGLIEKQLRNSFRGSTEIRCQTKLVRASKKKKNKKQKRNFQIDCQLMSDSTLVTNKTRQTRKHIINKNNNIYCNPFKFLNFGQPKKDIIFYLVNCIWYLYYQSTASGFSKT